MKGILSHIEGLFVVRQVSRVVYLEILQMGENSSWFSIKFYTFISENFKN